MADLITSLQSIYNTKLQIKSAIGTESDVFADYPSYITSLKPAGYAYITTNGDHDVNAYSYVNVNVPQGSAAVLGNLTVSENGEYSASTYSYDGFDTVSVNVPAVTPVLNSLSVFANGVYTPQTGVDGYNEVTVNVPTTGGHSGSSVYDAMTIQEALDWVYANLSVGESSTDWFYVKGIIAEASSLITAQYGNWNGWLTDDGQMYYQTEDPTLTDLTKCLYVYRTMFYGYDALTHSTWDANTDMQVHAGDQVVIYCQLRYHTSTVPRTINGSLIKQGVTAQNQLTITQSGTYDVQGYVSVVVDLTPAPATISKIQYSTGNNDGGVSSQVGDNWVDMTEDPATGVFNTPGSDSTHYNGNNYGGYIAFRTVYSDNSYTYLNVPHGYNNSIQYNTSGVCTEENTLVYFTWNDTFATNYIEINKNTLNFNVNRTPWILTSYKCSYNSSTGDYDIIGINATPGTINNMTAKLSGFENSYFYKFVCTVGNGRIIQDNIFATEQITLQDSDYAVTLDTAGSYYLTFNSTQLDDKILSVTFNGAESFNSISASWQPAPYVNVRYTSGGTDQTLKLKDSMAGTLTIDSQQVISVRDKESQLWLSSEGATCNSSSSGQSISLTQDMEMTAQNSNVTFEPGQYSITPAISGDSMMIYSVGLNVSYIGANS